VTALIGLNFNVTWIGAKKALQDPVLDLMTLL